MSENGKAHPKCVLNAGFVQCRPRSFFQAHPVFTHEEYAQSRDGGSPRTVDSLLRKHVQSGRIARVRRGTLRLGAPGRRRGDGRPLPGRDEGCEGRRGQPPRCAPVPRAHLLDVEPGHVPDARPHATVLTSVPVEYVPVRPPSAVADFPDMGGGIETVPSGGGHVRVCTCERAMVDLLHAPTLGGGWEEIWRSLEMIEFLDLDSVIAYALRLDSATTVARVGLFLEQHRERLFVEDMHLERLAAHAPEGPALPRHIARAGSPRSPVESHRAGACARPELGRGGLMLTRDQLQRAAADSGFPVDSLEKVWMLVRLLNMMAAHPFMGPRVALKGGTALNLFVFDVPRLSVDIDRQLRRRGGPSDDDRRAAKARRRAPSGRFCASGSR